VQVLSWVHAGVGARFTTIVPPAPSWGDYYILTVPVVLKFVLPLSERGHELQLGGGIGIGGYWERLDPAPGYLPPTSESITTMAYEALLGYVGPRTSTLLFGPGWYPIRGHGREGGSSGEARLLSPCRRLVAMSGVAERRAQGGRRAGRQRDQHGSGGPRARGGRSGGSRDRY